jgi:hypothetical protein
MNQDRVIAFRELMNIQMVQAFYNLLLYKKEHFNSMDKNNNTGGQDRVVADEPGQSRRFQR